MEVYGDTDEISYEEPADPVDLSGLPWKYIVPGIAVGVCLCICLVLIVGVVVAGTFLGIKYQNPIK